MVVWQRDIVEVPYPLPDGKIKTHPALVVSVDDILATEEIFYAVMLTTKNYFPEYTFEIRAAMLTKPSARHDATFACCQLIHPFPARAVIQKFGQMHKEPFRLLLNRFNEVMFGRK